MSADPSTKHVSAPSTAYPVPCSQIPSAGPRSTIPPASPTFSTATNWPLTPSSSSTAAANSSHPTACPSISLCGNCCFLTSGTRRSANSCRKRDFTMNRSCCRRTKCSCSCLICSTTRKRRCWLEYWRCLTSQSCWPQLWRFACCLCRHSRWSLQYPMITGIRFKILFIWASVE